MEVTPALVLRPVITAMPHLLVGENNLPDLRKAESLIAANGRRLQFTDTASTALLGNNDIIIVNGPHEIHWSEYLAGYNEITLPLEDWEHDEETDEWTPLDDQMVELEMATAMLAIKSSASED